MAVPIYSNQENTLSKRPQYGARSAAALALKAVLAQKQSLDHNIANASKHLAANDISLAKALCFGVLRHYESLSAQIDPLLEKPLRNKDYDIYALLLIGAYQLSAMRMPAYAALDSVVKASRELKKPWGSGLINAVLRKLQLQTPLVLSAQLESEHPVWLFNAIQQAWPEHAAAIFDANNTEPPLCLRINIQKTNRMDYLQQLADAGIQASAGKLAESAVYIHDKPSDITLLPGFAAGFCSVQDEAAQMAAYFLDAQPQAHILDACAAPGGKTCHILERLNNQATLTALDIDANRLQRVTENLERLQLTATLIAADIMDVDSWWQGQLFDAILCDAPCSATGVIRRHPDIKQLRQASDIEQLAQLQLEILQTLWRVLKPGGTLLYATCSIMPEENSRVIAQFCHQQADCIERKIDLPAGDSWLACEYGWQFFPQNMAHDGFYYARLEKTR